MSAPEHSAQQVANLCERKNRECTYACTYCIAQAKLWRRGDPFADLPTAEVWVSTRDKS